METSTKWDLRFLNLAKEVASWSKDPPTQVGAIITRGKKVVSLGFNGFPSGIVDDSRLDDRPTRLGMTIHAEPNAILQAKQDLSGCTIYVWPFMPCSDCALLVVQSGIKRVVAPRSDNPRWADSFTLSEEIFNEAGVFVQKMDKEIL